MSTSLPTASTLHSLPTDQRAIILDTLFEPCTQLHTLSITTLHDNIFDSYAALISAIEAQLTDLLTSNLASDQEWLEKILSAHPRLGEKKVETLSAASASEQAGLQSQSTEEGEMLRELNAKYEETFPGLRYVVFVNARPRPVIMDDMRRRIGRHDIKQEKADAIQAMCDIALDRARKMGG